MQNHTVKPVNEWVNAVFVISVKSFNNRIRHIEKEMAKHNIEFKFMFAHDADELDTAIIDSAFAPSNLEKTHQSLILKNIAIWEEAVKNNYSRILVFEDDVILSKNFALHFNTAMEATKSLKDGWLLFLGGSDVKVPDYYFLESGPLVALEMSTAEGIVSDLSSIKRRLEWIQNHKITLPADQLIRKIDKETGTQHFWLKKFIVRQGSTTGLFDSKLDAHRQKHSRLFTVIRNQWNLLRRQLLRRHIVRFKAMLLKTFSSNKP